MVDLGWKQVLLFRFGGDEFRKFVRDLDVKPKQSFPSASSLELSGSTASLASPPPDIVIMLLILFLLCQQPGLLFLLLQDKLPNHGAPLGHQIPLLLSSLFHVLALVLPVNAVFLREFIVKVSRHELSVGDALADILSDGPLQQLVWVVFEMLLLFQLSQPLDVWLVAVYLFDLVVEHVDHWVLANELAIRPKVLEEGVLGSQAQLLGLLHFEFDKHAELLLLLAAHFLVCKVKLIFGVHHVFVILLLVEWRLQEGVQVLGRRDFLVLVLLPEEKMDALLLGGLLLAHDFFLDVVNVDLWQRLQLVLGVVRKHRLVFGSLLHEAAEEFVSDFNKGLLPCNFFVH